MKIWLAWHVNNEKPDGLCGVRSYQTSIEKPNTAPSPCEFSRPVEWREFESVGVLSFPADRTRSKLARIRAILEEKD